MNPNVGQPSGGIAPNPFTQFLQKLQAAKGTGQPGQNMPAANGQTPDVPGGAPVSALTQAMQGAGGAGQAAGLPGVQQPQVEDAAMPGQNPGVSKNLIQAANALHGAIATMTNPREIQMVRSILVMLAQLIQMDQQTQNQKTGQMQPAQPGQANFGGGGAPGGMSPAAGGGGGTPPPFQGGGGGGAQPPTPPALPGAGGAPQVGTGQRM